MSTEYVIEPGEYKNLQNGLRLGDRVQPEDKKLHGTVISREEVCSNRNWSLKTVRGNKLFIRWDKKIQGHRYWAAYPTSVKLVRHTQEPSGQLLMF